MSDLVVQWNLSEAGGTPFDLVVHEASDSATTTVSVMADYYYRYEDEPDSPLQFLGSGVIGQALDVTVDLRAGDIRVFGYPRTEYGQSASKGIAARGAQIVYNVPSSRPSGLANVIAGEALTANQFVNLYNDSGVLKARKANATDSTRPCDGYVLDNITSGSEGIVYKGYGDEVPGTGLTIGTIYYLSTTGGEATATPPSASGNIIQQITKASAATMHLFLPEEPITLP